MLSETNTNEFVIYTVMLRTPKDVMSVRKIQKDIRKLEKWLHALMDKKDVIVVYEDDDGSEKMITGTRIAPHPGIELPIPPLEDEVVNGVTRQVANYCCFFSTPQREPTMIHFNKIKKFIVSQVGVNEISRSIEWH
jgi:hypothetical protein